MSISLSVRKLGHVPSFKNGKMWTGKKLITKPERQRWMEECIASFASQLLSVYQTEEQETPTGRSLHSWIASSLPVDDSVSYAPELRVNVEYVPAGDEGADILIEEVMPK